MSNSSPNPDGVSERLKRKRWSVSVIREMANLAREKAVSIRLEPDGTVVIAPAPTAPGVEDTDPKYSGLKDW